MEPVYRTLEAITAGIRLLQGTRLDVGGLDNIPEGGGVLAINHTGYVDFLPVGLALRQRGRRARFMVKSELTDVPITRFLVAHTGSLPVDRSAGADAYRAAVDALRNGELVAVYPEATISRSFELKEFKTGAARMAVESGAPVIPVIVWGSQRQLSKGTERNIGRARIPIHTRIGAPLMFDPTDDAVEATHRLHDAMVAQLHRVQDEYPDAPAGADWLPARLGGSAPTPEEALVIEDAEAREKAARRAAKRQGE
ncbi:1-acyl-sn-glycerol-3-phosphate acyltransferase [Gordonia sp. HY002]|uniref:lysophospholipid acyltransferase family protein n=1 Tax=Gordonia zhenghanii TaxID=2911516 RepID=UPI001EF0DB77|nr:lysophospholipid acyltransferase family protein [Gordonia zhenghanii]MCF8571553.1 1-acyl-sn-glycerol-3-phosphate acyltransferase [Gordonia zhenghanii]MCF8602150.1 1-acyl-sn-glycerol-3-phosphate acyltransferase [Gordonia zhenghanii]